MQTLRKPAWLRKRLPTGSAAGRLETDLAVSGLLSICQEACCPNMGECFSKGTAAFLILGNRCTRNCRFCAVAHGRPSAVDPAEPTRLAAEIKRLGLEFAVVTSVTRDDLPDGGAAHFARTIAAVHRACSGAAVEVLVPDFNGQESSVAAVVAATPEVFNHNVETVPRLYQTIRPGADYRRSLRVLQTARKLSPETVTKSGMMVGLGETGEEVSRVMEHLREAGCRILTIGQYLCPSSGHHPVVEYVPSETYDRYRSLAMDLGFWAVSAGPFVRSSYEALAHYHRAVRSRNHEAAECNAASFVRGRPKRQENVS